MSDSRSAAVSSTADENTPAGESKTGTPGRFSCAAHLIFLSLLMFPVTGLAEVPEERVLLLRTGRVVKGHMRQISTGWLVNAKHGRLSIPADQVRFDADSVEDIYLSLRLQLLRDPTVGKHLNLADWCLGQGLTDQATLEVRAAMTLDPMNETARLMLKRLRTYLEREAAATQPEPDRDQIAEARARVEVNQSGVAARKEVRSLAGLKPATAQQFVRTVQPILFNGCANARCHGQASQNEFRLERFRYGSGSHRIRSERNLASILKYVDSAEPGRSRLLTAASDGHSGRTVFHGTAGAGQVASLTAWVQAAAAELFPDARRTASRPTRDLPEFQPQISLPSTRPSGTRSVPQADTTIGLNPPQILTPPLSPSEPRPATTEVPAVRRSPERTEPSQLRGFQDVLRETEAAGESGAKSDAFDPEAFNRRYAGRRS